MSPANLNDANSRWQALLAVTVVDTQPPDMLGMSGTWLAEDIWHHRPRHELEVRLPEAPVERIAELLPETVADPDEVLRAIVQTVAERSLAKGARDWETARDAIVARLGRGIGSVVLGGVVSSAVDPEGFASAVRLGAHAVAGHLEPSIDKAATDLAHRHDLPGYRFSEDSWWTEDFLATKEDQDRGAELMEELEARGSWPWLALVVGVPASGPAIEAATIAAAQALLGALVMLDQPPGRFWLEPVPWIAGGLGPAVDPRCPGDESREFAISIDPQHLDAQCRRLDNAESTIEGAPARVIDLAAHANGPAGGLLTAVLDSSLGFEGRPEALAKACRLVWLAAASETADTSFALARAAATELLSGEAPQAVSKAERGARWRLDNDEIWPEGQPLVPLPDVASWHAQIGEATSFLDSTPAAPSWSFQGSGQAAVALGVVQALFFAEAVSSDG
jgi:hypothetical protein